MKKTMKKMMFMFAAALMMVACSNEEVAVNDEVQYVSELKVNFEGGSSRVEATHNPASGLKFAWDDGDELYVFKNIENNAIKGIYKYDESAGSFTLNSGHAMEAGEDYFAVMRPSSMLNESNLGTENVQVELEWGKNSTIKKLPLISNVFKAEADGTIATMYHLMGMVEISVKANKNGNVDNFNIYDGNQYKIAGTFIATPKAPYFKEVKSGSGYYKAYLNESKTLSTETATTIFIPVLPGTHTMSLNYNYTDSDNEDVSRQNSLGTFTVERGKITKINEEIILNLD